MVAWRTASDSHMVSVLAAFEITPQGLVSPSCLSVNSYIPEPFSDLSVAVSNSLAVLFLWFNIQKLRIFIDKGRVFGGVTEATIILMSLVSFVSLLDDHRNSHHHYALGQSFKSICLLKTLVLFMASF